MMSGIRGKNTKPELVVRRYLHNAGLRFRLHRRDLPGRPDITLSKYRTVINVHGCFWHQHPGCRFAYVPTSNVAFWQEKFRGNQARDCENDRRLRRSGWRVLTVWECQARDERLLRKLVTAIKGRA